MLILYLLGAVVLLGAVLYWLFMSSYSQVFGYFPFRAKTPRKVVALTFDDGPNEPYTTQIADYLDSKGITATFFEVGKCVQKYPEVTRRLYASGHVVANHSLSHAFRNYFKSARFANEIIKTQEIITRTIGVTPALYRSPWLFRQPWLLQTLRAQSLTPISGEFCHALEPWQPHAERIARRTLAKIRPGEIIIFHDGREARGGDRSQTAMAVELVVEELLRQGYEFTTVDKLLGVPAYQESAQ